jgi:hypothetical protein
MAEAALWGFTRITRGRSSLRSHGLRFLLGQKLYGMKSLLAMCGRGEQWPAFLQRRRIPRLTAEQWVTEQEASF